MTELVDLICPTCRVAFQRKAYWVVTQAPCCSYKCSAIHRGIKNFRRLEERFLERTKPENGCLLWTGWLDKDGYGFMSVRGKEERAHRIAYYLKTEEWPNQLVLHKCDNPTCVKFKHLFLGSYQDNHDDMRRKGRGTKGIVTAKANPATKLDEDKVREIKRRLGSERITQTALAKEYGVSAGVISNISRGKAWYYVK